MPAGPRGRFAPSPTGRLHLGNARSALLGYLQMRALKGQFLLRIEDLDAGRVRPGAVEGLMADLRYLGLTWDEPPVVQSQRAAAYGEALAQLAERGLVYPCFCSRAEISRAASAPHGPSDDGPVYPGTCATLGVEEQIRKGQGRTPALRFRVGPGTVSFIDSCGGAQQEDVQRQVGDFVVRRNDGVASYQLAVVVDDAASEITHVLRGADLLSSTARQWLLYRALGLAVPAFAHVPLLMGTDGKRLAKREGAFALEELRVRGVGPERVLGLLAQWSGLGDGSPVTLAALVRDFRLERVSSAPVTVDEAGIARALGL